MFILKNVYQKISKILKFYNIRKIRIYNFENLKTVKNYKK